MTDWLPMMAMTVSIAFAGPISCAIALGLQNWNISSGPLICTTSCLISIKPVYNGESFNEHSFLLSNATNGLLAISRYSRLVMLLNHPLLHLLKAKASPSKRRPKICLMLSWHVLNKCSPCSTIFLSHLLIISLSETCVWQKSSRRFLAPFAVRMALLLFATSVAIFPPCRSRGTPCCPLLLLFFMATPYLSLGVPE